MRYILWSGGWDSTYLLCKRARESDEIIQPIYMTDDHAHVEKERERRRTLLSLIRTKSDIKAEIREPIEIAEEALPPSPAYNAAYAKYSDTLQGMFRSLGRLTLIFPQPEIAIEAPAPGTRANNMGKIETLMLDHGLQIDSEGRITPGIGDPDILILLGCYQFPLLHINTAQMLADVRAWGYFDDVFQHTWSCYTGQDTPCGVCRGCEIKLNYGDLFHFMFSEQALKDHEIKMWLSKKYGENLTDYFRKYAMNHHWVSVENENGKTDEEKTETLMLYFSYLENNWPNVEDINAPTL